MSERLMIYGAYGYSGELIAREAVARGLEPILAGRRPEPLDALAHELGCESRPFQLDTGPIVERRLEDVAVVLHCAGPFSTTFRPMVEGCLAARTHYLDITGEIDVLESLARRDAAAREAGVVLLPAVGFDVVPTDCLAVFLAEQLPDADRLEIAIQALGRLSRGTTRTMIENLGRPGRVRRGGALVDAALLEHTRRVDFGDGERDCVAIPWGDLATAYRSTGIGDITVYAAMSGRQRFGLRLASWFGWLLGSRPVQAFLKSRVDPGGPSEQQRSAGRSTVWARVERQDGEAREALLTGPEGYAWTTRLAVDAAERVLAAHRAGDGSLATGFQTPGKLFGADFVLGEGVERRGRG
ncbi:MAG: saccharopine dehydrogenase [Acidobacteria bacterium]|nr:MAG: saccharopine dehydrogenase [Acidobacteriota bacterium]REJ99641.1 MAG: saccharopine dehydrogenase [Acidobacteriota bacterium]